MKKVLFITMLVISASLVRAQVLIGKNEAPEKGTFLDLNPKNVVRGGLLLPNIPITNADSIPTDLIGSFTAAERDNYPALKGMIVYNTNKSMSGGNGEGIYTWDGSQWNSSSGGSVFTSACTTTSAIAATGGALSCTVHDSHCPTGGVYNFHFIAGAEYAKVLATDAGAGKFTLTFEANNRAENRTAILMATSPCGKNQTLFYIQSGDNTGCDTSATAPKIRAENNQTTLCSGGTVYLYLDGAPAGNYVWTLNGEEVGMGSKLSATRAGKYIVYANKIGCTKYKPDTLTVNASSTIAPGMVPAITQANNGFVCAADSTVKLYVTDAISGTISWYKDGRKTSQTGKSINAGIGKWFAVVEEGSCVSKSSEEVTVKLDPHAGTAGIQDFTFTINNTPLSDTLNLCAGSTLNLSVPTPQNGVDYTWYNNNTVIGQGASIVSGIAGQTGSFILRCRATGHSACAKEKIVKATIIAGAPLVRPVITVSNPGDALCSGSAILTANVSGTVNSYIWYYSADNTSYNRLPATTQTLSISTTGFYKVSSVSGSCVSEQSGAKNIALSSALTGISISGPSTSINQGDSKTYTARMDNPQGAKYAWSVSSAGTTGATIQGPTNGNSVVVNYASAGNATISLSATNACGDANPKPATLDITVSASCTNAFVSPASTAGNQNVTVVANQTLSLSISSGGSPTLSYQWYKKGVAISGATASAYTKNSAAKEDEGDYYCIATSSCNSSTATSATFVVKIIADPGTITAGVGSLRGNTCFDIAEAAVSGGACGDITSRASNKADFASLSAADKTYTFTAQSTDVSNVRFVVIDNENCVESTSNLTPNGSGALANGSSVSLQVNYKTTLNQANSSPSIRSRNHSQAAVVGIYVIYWDGSKDVSVPLKVTIQDCACCSALVSASPDKWKTFMCHNLGADESSNPFVPSFATNGAYYQWGRKDQAKSAPNVSGADVTNITWNTQTPTGYFGNNTDNPDVTVKSQYDPCPTGFRIPSYSEWEGVIKYNKASYVGTWTTTDCISCWAGVQLGHGLMLPAAGNRANPIGAVFERSRLGAYWSTRTKSDMANVMHISGNNIAMSAIYKQVGYSVRCIAE